MPELYIPETIRVYDSIDTLKSEHQEMMEDFFERPIDPTSDMEYCLDHIAMSVAMSETEDISSRARLFYADVVREFMHKEAYLSSAWFKGALPMALVHDQHVARIEDVVSGLYIFNEGIDFNAHSGESSYAVFYSIATRAKWSKAVSRMMHYLAVFQHYMHGQEDAIDVLKTAKSDDEVRTILRESEFVV